MKPIGLAGDPHAIDAVGVALTAMCTKRGLPLHLHVGIRSIHDAYVIHHHGGEVWLCGPDAPVRDLVGRIDRVVPADTPAAIDDQVAQCLDSFLAKCPID